jgi:hypothetical protein
MHDSEKLDGHQLEAAAATLVGQLVMALSGLEFNIDLYLRSAVGGSDVDAVNPLITRLSFKSKIDALNEVVAHKFASDEFCIAEFSQWFKAVEKFRVKRNSFVHGRWGVHQFGQQVVNVAPGLPNSRPQKETRYSLDQLGKELSQANQVVAAFNQWSSKWPL